MKAEISAERDTLLTLMSLNFQATRGKSVSSDGDRFPRKVHFRKAIKVDGTFFEGYLQQSRSLDDF